MKVFREKSTLILSILVGIVLIGKVFGRFLDFSDETHQLLNTAMFSLIGVSYLTFAWAYEKPLLKAIFLICGIYVILMNFIPDFGWMKTIIGIVCILTPMIIGRFFPNEGQEVTNS